MAAECSVTAVWQRRGNCHLSSLLVNGKQLSSAADDVTDDAVAEPGVVAYVIIAGCHVSDHVTDVHGWRQLYDGGWRRVVAAAGGRCRAGDDWLIVVDVIDADQYRADVIQCRHASVCNPTTTPRIYCTDS